MSARLLADALAAFALEHPDRPLSAVTAVEFAVWYHDRGRK